MEKSSDREAEAGVGIRAAIPPLLLHLLAVAVVSAVVFDQNRQYLFLGYDGTYNWLKVKLQHDWMPPGLSFGNNPLQEFGNVFLAHNCWLFPCYLLGGMLGTGAAQPVAIYTLSAVFLFAASYAAWRCFEVGGREALMASWLTCILCLPLIRPLVGYQITVIVPHYSALVIETTLACALFFRVGRGGAGNSILCGLLAAAVILHAAASGPPVFLLAAPAYGVLILFSFLRARDRRERVHKLRFLVLFSLAAAVSIVPFLVGTILYSVPTFFSPELVDYRRTLVFASILFIDRTTGGILLGLCLVGAWAGLRRDGDRRNAPVARLGLAAWGLILLAGLLTTYAVTHYIGPSPRDFELFFYPLYALLAGIGLLACLDRGRALMQRGAAAAVLSGRRAWCAPGAAVGAALLLYAVGPWARQSTGYEFPMGETALGTHLRDEAGLTEGGPYRGAVATITRKGLPEPPVSWPDQISLDVTFTRAMGNDFRAHGLWRLNVPTVFAYNQLMTPAYYGMVTRMLARPVDRQLRNVLVLTEPDPDYLAGIGVRYVIVNGYAPPPYEKLTGGKMVLLPEYSYSVDNYPGYLFELRNPNLGTYSPIRQVLITSAAEALQKLQDAEAPFDYSREVLLAERVGADLAPAETARVSIGREGMRVQASSPGTSLLLLPLQYSHCLNLLPADSVSPAPRLVRANIMQAGLVFSGKTDVLISFRYGPFQNQFGRLRDYLDMRELRLSEIGFGEKRARP